MKKINRKSGMVACAILLPLILTGCGGKSDPCKEISKTFKSANIEIVEKRADHFLDKQKRVLSEKHGKKITFKPSEKKCVKGGPKVDENGKKTIEKASCEVKLPYCLGPLIDPNKKAKGKDEKAPAQQ